MSIVLTSRRPVRGSALPALLLFLPFILTGGCEACGQSAPPAKIKKDNQAAKIQALPYLATAPVKEEEREKVGVTSYRKGEAVPGITVYCSEETDRVFWIDMEGNVRHEIPVPGGSCKLLKFTGQGDFLILGDGTLARMDWTGKVSWQLKKAYDPTSPGRQSSFHHDMDVSGGGEIYALTNNNRRVRHKGKLIPIRDDEISIFTGAGKRRRSYSLFNLVGKKWIKPRLLDRILRRVEKLGLKGLGWDDVTDIMHANTLKVLKKGTPFGRQGQVLICMRYLDLVALLDLKRQKVVWSWGPGVLEWPHHPTVLDNGHLLIYDNGSRRKWSRVLELDPAAGKVVWQYGAKAGESRFFSDTRGSAQALPGDNLLITQSDTGRIFEINRRGAIVWEYWNPALVETKKRTERRLIYRAARFTPGSLGIPELEAKFQ